MSIKSIIKTIGFWSALGFGSGKASFAPGTFGTMVAIPLIVLLDYLPVWYQIIIIIAGYFWGIRICGQAATTLNTEDPSVVVWDEIIGFMLAMFLIPLSIWSLLIGFALFRFFDILKPFPIRFFERKVKGGAGIMFDDVLASLYTWSILQAIMWYGGWYF